MVQYNVIIILETRLVTSPQKQENKYVNSYYNGINKPLNIREKNEHVNHFYHDLTLCNTNDIYGGNKCLAIKQL